ncbi:MAG: alpha/beta hydrolase [Verrucomicrobia bacterium]|nr:alpha/beta hydrolase [Verrucomicrobiota bacterium]
MHAPLCLGLCSVLFVTCGGIGSLRGQPDSLPGPAHYGAAIEVVQEIAFGKSEHQKLDLYRPASGEPTPVVVCWFGGAFWGGNPWDMTGVASFLASRGFAAVAPGYFLGTKEGSRAAWPQAVHDAKAAVRFVRANASQLKVDGGRVVALGYSSGAYLAAMVGYTPNLRELEGEGANLDVSSRVSAVVAMAGVYDRRRDLGLPLGLLGKGYEEKIDLRVATSPVIYVHSRSVPTYLLHGRDDTVADVSSATQLAGVLAAAGVRHELRLVETGHYPISAAELERIVEWLRRIL